jgi:sporulation protein YlmC with PRC-barrel domain
VGMYILASQLKKLPVMSLQTGQAVAIIEKPVVNSANLEVMALSCSQGHDQTGVLLMRDIRQIASDCVIIDSEDEISDPADIVRLKTVAAANFEPVGKIVVNESGRKLGKVEDYTINSKTHLLQQLYVHQSLMRSILFNSLMIDRTQIVDVTAKHFVVRDATIKAPITARSATQIPK